MAPAAQAGAGVQPCKSTRGRVLEGPGEGGPGRNQESRSVQKLDPGMSGKALGGRPVAEHSKVCPWVQQPTVSDLEGTLWELTDQVG